MKCTEHITKPPTERPLVTVITPYYKNSLQEIRQTIQSVASQRYPRIQYILVDDGSPCVAPDDTYLIWRQTIFLRTKMFWKIG